MRSAPRRRLCILRSPVVVAIFLGAVTSCFAQETSQDAILRRLDELERKLEARDARIEQLETEVEELKEELGQPTAPAAAPAGVPSEKAAAPVVTDPDIEADVEEAPHLAGAAPPAEKSYFGDYTQGRGFGIGRNEFGELRISGFTYVRYLNQKGLDDTYVNHFGDTVEIDRRDDVVQNKAKLDFRGWLVNERMQYLFFVWTNNTNQGLGAQLVLAGWLRYVFDESFVLGGGVYPVPTTRSTQGNFPRWLTVDARPPADEFFRGSYTFGFFAGGKLARGLEYSTMLANNLSTLGVNAGQLDGEFTTTSTALWWMPTTGEFGPISEFGDYAWHEDVATRLGLHFTFSPEDKESQPGEDDPENTQIRLSDGTIIFTPGALAPGVSVRRVNYYMAAVDAGVKYRGLSLEGEYYLRWLNNIKADGPIPESEFFDHGFQLQASGMLLPQTLQAYSHFSTIFGEYGDPWTASAGLNWYVFRRREVRVNLEYLYDHRSPVGYFAIPHVVGGTGSIFHANFELYF